MRRLYNYGYRTITRCPRCLALRENIGPGRDPQIVKNLQMQVMHMRHSSCLPHCSCNIEHSLYWCLVLGCLSALTCAGTTVCCASATSSALQGAGALINFMKRAVCQASLLLRLKQVSARGHLIKRIKSVDYIRIVWFLFFFFFHRMPLSLRYHPLTEVSGKIKCKQV